MPFFYTSIKCHFTLILFISSVSILLWTLKLVWMILWIVFNCVCKIIACCTALSVFPAIWLKIVILCCSSMIILTSGSLNSYNLRSHFPHTACIPHISLLLSTHTSVQGQLLQNIFISVISIQCIVFGTIPADQGMLFRSPFQSIPFCCNMFLPKSNSSKLGSNFFDAWGIS